MAVPLTVPRATISMEQGKLVRWLKRQGETVQKGETVYELETDKAVLEVPAPEDGVLLTILLEHGDAAVDSIVGWVGASGESVPTAHASVPPDPQPAVRRVAGTPAARRRAGELGVAIDSLTGTGPSGRITIEDVELAARSKSAKGRSALGQQVTISWQTVPHIHVFRRLDAEALVATRESVRAGGIDASFTDLILFAVSRVLPQFSSLTMLWDGEALKPSPRRSIGFAVDAGDAVLTPVLQEPDLSTLKDVAQNRRALVAAARAGRLKAGENAAFTITNLGMYGADFFVPIIRLPETAILAIGRITQEPVVRKGAVSAAWMFWANLAVDHRVTDGATAARFLDALERSFSQLQVA
jgi:pyruvate dehydrogenase E2 component (dihydrolipoamide acetyltransferase)